MTDFRRARTDMPHTSGKAVATRPLDASASPKQWGTDLECVHQTCHAAPQSRYDFPIPLCRSHFVKVLAVSAQVAADAKAEFARLNDHAPSGVSHAKESHEPLVYYVRFGDRIKIGTTTHLKKRLSQIPHDEILGTEPGGTKVERTRHLQFVNARISAEWFKDCPSLRTHIDSLAGVRKTA